jgi:hypothetical protein
MPIRILIVRRMSLVFSLEDLLDLI